MSMIGCLLHVSPERLEMFQQNSLLLEEYAGNEELLTDGQFIDIDKSWDALLFLLTGHSVTTVSNTGSVLKGIMFSGQLLDAEQDMGYGPAHYLDGSQVQAVHAALAAISPEQLRQLYDADKMNQHDVYPGKWLNSEDSLIYLTEYFMDLKIFYSKAATAGEAVITWLV